jgi:tRNA (guanine37-N1)-methyltransferase
MKIDIVTLFPNSFDSFLNTSLIARGIKKDILNIDVHDLRTFSTDRHRSVDDTPYGGGPGMVLRVDLIDKMINSILSKSLYNRKNTKIILLTPQGQKFDQTLALNLSNLEQIIYICGHYEGFDERVRTLVDLELSLGDFVLTGGELAAMVTIDAIARMIPNFLGKDESSHEESFGDINGQQLLEYPQYTRPQVFNNLSVPEILLSGNHAKIKEWRYNQAYLKTIERRPDLLNNKIDKTPDIR